MKPETVAQGQTYDFTVTVSGEDTLTGTFEVKQYPGDTAAVTGSLTNNDGEFTGTLTSANTLSLAVGQWFIFSELTDADENISNPNKLYVTKGWA